MGRLISKTTSLKKVGLIQSVEVLNKTRRLTPPMEERILFWLTAFQLEYWLLPCFCTQTEALFFLCVEAGSIWKELQSWNLQLAESLRRPWKLSVLLDSLQPSMWPLLSKFQFKARGGPSKVLLWWDQRVVLLTITHVSDQKRANPLSGKK